MTPARLRELAELAGTVRDRELSKVEAIVGAMNRLRADISAIETLRAERLNNPALDVARLSGAELAWMAASEDRLRLLQSQLAALRAGHETALAEARRAFGRAEVASRLSGDIR